LIIIAQILGNLCRRLWSIAATIEAYFIESDALLNSIKKGLAAHAQVHYLELFFAPWSMSMTRVGTYTSVWLQRWICRLIKGKTIVGLPWVAGSIGDTLSYYHYIYLKTRQSGAKVLCLAPQAFPHLFFFPFLFNRNEYVYLDQQIISIFRQLIFLGRERSEAGIWHQENNKAADSLIMNILRKELLKYPAYRDSGLDRPFRKKRDSLMREVKRRQPRLAKDYARYRAGNTFAMAHADYLNILENNWNASFLCPPTFDHKKKENFLHELGLTGHFVGLHIKYLEERLHTSARHIKDIQSYLSGVRWLKSLGYQVVLFGALDEVTAMSSICPELIEEVIPYAAMPQHGLENDLYLVAACRFFIGCCSGPAQYCDFFAKPLLRLNSSYLASIETKATQRFYPKPLQKLDGTYADWFEVINHPSIYTNDLQQYLDLGVRPSDMSGVEVLNAIQEFHELVNGPAENWSRLSTCQTAYRNSLGPEHGTMWYAQAMLCDCYLERYPTGT
jgi:putative glycosyltransferase (TIGR04372 family)